MVKIGVTYLCTEAAKKCKPKMAQGKCKVLVEEVAEELAHAVVGPAAVHQEKSLEEAELGDGVIAGQHCLQTFLA